MDLSRAPADRKVYLCKWYFIIGFALLPFVWAANSIWFFNEAFKRPPYKEQKEIKIYVILSGIGALLWAIGLGTWITVFQANRVAWGEFADRISFIIPLVVTPISLTIWFLIDICKNPFDQQRKSLKIMMFAMAVAIFAYVIREFHIAYGIKRYYRRQSYLDDLIWEASRSVK